MIPPCLILSNIRLVSRVKWSNLGKVIAPSPTPLCSSYWKGSLRATLDYSRQLYSFINESRKKGSERWCAVLNFINTENNMHLSQFEFWGLLGWSENFLARPIYGCMCVCVCVCARIVLKVMNKTKHSKINK